MTHLTQTIVDNLIAQSLHLAILFVVVLAATLLLQNRSAHLRYLLWLLLIAKCLTPPLHTVSLAVLPEAMDEGRWTIDEGEGEGMDEGRLARGEGIGEGRLARGDLADVRESVGVAEPAEEHADAWTANAVGTAQPTGESRPQAGGISAKVWVAAAWLGGTIGYFLMIAVRAVRFDRYVRSERVELTAQSHPAWMGFLSAALPNAKPVRVYQLSRAGQPFVWGLWRGAVYLPGNFADVNDPHKQQSILMHEAGHILRFDPLVNLLQVVAQGLFWFHPLVWAANRRIRAEREKCCDEFAVATLKAAPRSYCSAIVDALMAAQSARPTIPTLAVAGPVKNIEDRIKTLLAPGKRFYTRPTLAVMLTVLLLAAIVVPTTIVLSHRAGDQSQPLQTELMVHRYVPEGQPVYFHVKGVDSDWKHPYRQVSLPKLYVRINGREYESGGGASPFGIGATYNTTNLYKRENGRRQRIELPPGTYRMTAVYKNVFGHTEDRPEDIVNLGDIESNEAVFEVVQEVPDDYFQPITKKDWPSILEQSNIGITYEIERDRPDKMYWRVRGLVRPFALCFDMYLQPEGSGEEFFTGRFTIPSHFNGTDIYAQNITVEQLTAGRYRVILRPSVAAALENPPIREFYGDVYVTDYMVIQPVMEQLLLSMRDAGFSKTGTLLFDFLSGQPYWAIDLDDRSDRQRNPQADWPGRYEFVRDAQDHVYRLNPAGSARAIRLDAVRIDAVLEEFRERLEELDNADRTDIDIRPSEQPQYYAIKTDQGAIYLIIVIVTDQGWFSISKPQPETMPVMFYGRYDEQARIIDDNMNDVDDGPYASAITDIEDNRDNMAEVVTQKSEVRSQGSGENPEDRDQNTEFTAVLDNGVTVELVGVCKHPDDGRWWGPNGNPLVVPAFEARMEREPMHAIPAQYTLLVRAAGGNNNALRMKIHEGIGYSTPFFDDGTALCIVKHPQPEQTFHQDAFIKGPVMVGVAQGDWIKARDGEPETLNIPRSFLIGARDQIVIQPPQQDKPDLGVTTFWGSCTSHDYDLKLVCTLKDGTTRQYMRAFYTHCNTIETDRLKNTAINTVNFSFDQTPIDQISGYELYYREYQYARFNNVAFQAGVKTEVEVVAQDSEVRSREAEGNTEVSGQKTEFTAVLDNGVTVELVGICEHPSEGYKWWRPDGSLMDGRPYEKLGRSRRHDVYPLYELVYRISNGKEVVSNVLSGAGAVIGTSGPYPVTEIAEGIWIDRPEEVYYSGIYSKLKSGDIVLLVGNENAWKTDTSLKGDIENAGVNGPSAMINGAIERDGKVFVNIAHTVTGGQCRVVAVDVNGVIHKPISLDGGYSNHKNMGHLQVSFDLAADEIESIEFQTQEFVRVEFKDVAFRPGVKTEVEVVAQDSEVRSREAEGNTEVSGQKTEFTAVLDNGVVVELLGVSEYSEEAIHRNWWAPDGRPLDTELVNIIPSEFIIDKDTPHRYVIAYQLKNEKNARPPFVMTRRNNGDDGLFESSIFGNFSIPVSLNESRELTHYGCVIVTSQTPLETHDVALKYSSDRWEVAATHTAEEIDSENGWTIKDALGKTEISFPMSLANEFLPGSAIAIDRLGNVHYGHEAQLLSQRYHATFNRSLSEFREFQVRRPIYGHVTFKNVALRADAKTEVEIEVQKPEVRSQAAERNTEASTQNSVYAATQPNGITIDIPLPVLTAHQYYKTGEQIEIGMENLSSDWKPSLEDILTDGGMHVIVMINGKEYGSRLGTGPFGGAVSSLRINDLTYEKTEFPPGRYRFAYGWKDLDVIDPGNPGQPMHFDRLITNEVEFEVVDELPADYFMTVYEEGWDEILASNIEPWFTDDFRSIGLAGVLLGLKVHPLPFDIAFDVYAQAEDMDEPEYAKRLARSANAQTTDLCWVTAPSLTWDNVGEKRWRIILKPSQEAAAERPPIRHYYGREFTTDWLTFSKSDRFDQHREMFDKSQNPEPQTQPPTDNDRLAKNHVEAELKRIFAACQIYKMDLGTWPQRLDDLLAEDGKGPYIKWPDVDTPDSIYFIQTPGPPDTDPANVPYLYNSRLQAGHNQTAILFLDGRLEWLTPDQLADLGMSMSDVEVEVQKSEVRHQQTELYAMPTDEVRPMWPTEAARVSAVGYLKEVSAVYLNYLAENEAAPPRSLFDLEDAFLTSPPPTLSYIQAVRHDEPIAEDALSTTPLLVDRHTLFGRAVVAYWDGRIEVMRDQTFAALIDERGFVLSDQRQVALECRFFMFNEGFDETIGIDIANTSLYSGHVISGPINTIGIQRLLDTQASIFLDMPLQENPKETILDDQQVRTLLQAAQQRNDLRQLTAPRAVVLNGEWATLEVKTSVGYTDTDGLTKSLDKGLRIAVQPFIEKDQSIRLQGDFRMVDVIGEKTQVVEDRDFSIPVAEIVENQFHRIIPNGATVLLDGGLMQTPAQSNGVHKWRLLYLIKPTIIED